MEKVQLPFKLNGQRLELKQHIESDANIMFEYVNHDRERLSQFFPWVHHTRSKQDTLKFIEMTQSDWEKCIRFDYGLFLKKQQLYLGNVGVVRIAWPHKRCEIGYWIFSQFEGYGYVSEAVDQLENVLFRTGFNRIEIRCASHNSRLANIPRNKGYHLDGRLVENEFFKGKPHDTLIFSKLKKHVKSAT